jgi:hypothetical protein
MVAHLDVSHDDKSHGTGHTAELCVLRRGHEWELKPLRKNRNSPSARLFAECAAATSGSSSHYKRTEIPRVPHSSLSAKNRALGEANLPRVLHLEKRAFPECREAHDTRGRVALGEGHLP